MKKPQRNIERTSVVIIGCGNLAWHLAEGFSKHANLKLAVFNHTENAQLLAFKKKFGVNIHIGFENLPANEAVYILCVSDTAIKEVLQNIQIKNPKAILLHTSGSTSIDVFKEHLQAHGVLYPLQSFSKDAALDWGTTPILVEGSSPAALKSIKALANSLSGTVLSVDSKRRLQLHLSAVLVNNFTNALYAAADRQLTQAGYAGDFKLLEPIIKSGIDKANKLGPLKAQTGPAKRGDKKTMTKHMGLLKHDRQLKKVYKELSKLIRTQQHGRA